MMMIKGSVCLSLALLLPLSSAFVPRARSPIMSSVFPTKSLNEDPNEAINSLRRSIAQAVTPGSADEFRDVALPPGMSAAAAPAKAPWSPGKKKGASSGGMPSPWATPSPSPSSSAPAPAPPAPSPKAPPSPSQPASSASSSSSTDWNSMTSTWADMNQDKKDPPSTPPKSPVKSPASKPTPSPATPSASKPSSSAGGNDLANMYSSTNNLNPDTVANEPAGWSTAAPLPSTPPAAPKPSPPPSPPAVGAAGGADLANMYSSMNNLNPDTEANQPAGWSTASPLPSTPPTAHKLAPVLPPVASTSRSADGNNLANKYSSMNNLNPGTEANQPMGWSTASPLPSTSPPPAPVPPPASRPVSPAPPVVRAPPPLPTPVPRPATRVSPPAPMSTPAPVRMPAPVAPSPFPGSMSQLMSPVPAVIQPPTGPAYEYKDHMGVERPPNPRVSPFPDLKLPSQATDQSSTGQAYEYKDHVGVQRPQTPRVSPFPDLKAPGRAMEQPYNPNALFNPGDRVNTPQGPGVVNEFREADGIVVVDLQKSKSTVSLSAKSVKPAEDASRSLTGDNRIFPVYTTPKSTSYKPPAISPALKLSSSSPFDVGTHVKTPHGPGVVKEYRSAEGMVVVDLDRSQNTAIVNQEQVFVIGESTENSTRRRFPVQPPMTAYQRAANPPSPSMTHSPQSYSDKFYPGLKVETPHGEGVVFEYREADGIVVVDLDKAGTTSHIREEFVTLPRSQERSQKQRFAVRPPNYVNAKAPSRSPSSGSDNGGVSASSQFCQGERVKTPNGPGIVKGFDDDLVVVELDRARTTAHVRADQVISFSSDDIDSRRRFPVGPPAVALDRHRAPPSSARFDDMNDDYVGYDAKFVRGQSVNTPHGPGIVNAYRPSEGIVVVDLEKGQTTAHIDEHLVTLPRAAERSLKERFAVRPPSFVNAKAPSRSPVSRPSTHFGDGRFYPGERVKTPHGPGIVNEYSEDEGIVSVDLDRARTTAYVTEDLVFSVDNPEAEITDSRRRFPVQPPMTAYQRARSSSPSSSPRGVTEGSSSQWSSLASEWETMNTDYEYLDMPPMESRGPMPANARASLREPFREGDRVKTPHGPGVCLEIRETEGIVVVDLDRALTTCFVPIEYVTGIPKTPARSQKQRFPIEPPNAAYDRMTTPPPRPLSPEEINSRGRFENVSTKFGPVVFKEFREPVTLENKRLYNEGDKVRTPHGPGVVLEYREADKMLVVKIGGSKTAYVSERVCRNMEPPKRAS